MSGEISPSAIWLLGIDAPVVLDAYYTFDKGSRRYLDSQILGLETHAINSLLTGAVCTWLKLDPTSAAGTPGQCVCLAGQFGATVTLATSTTLAAAGAPLGVLMTAGAPGSTVRIALAGTILQRVSGLPITGGLLYARVNITSSALEAVSSLSTSDYPMGTVDVAGNLTLRPSAQVTTTVLVGVTPWTRITSGPTQLVSGEEALVDVTSAAITLRTPVAPSDASEFAVTCVDGLGTHALTIDPNATGVSLNDPNGAPGTFAALNATITIPFKGRYRWKYDAPKTRFLLV